MPPEKIGLPEVEVTHANERVNGPDIVYNVLSDIRQSNGAPERLATIQLSTTEQREIANMVEEAETITVPEYEDAVALAEIAMLERLEQRFGQEGEQLPFHNIEHSRRVMEASQRIYLRAIGISRGLDQQEFERLENLPNRELREQLGEETWKKLCLLHLEAAAHDLVQRSVVKNGKRVRLRGTKTDVIDPDLVRLYRESYPKDDEEVVGNEAASTEELVMILAKFHNQNGEPFFDLDPEQIQQDIDSTHPEFEVTPDGRLHISQHNVGENSSLEAWALAMADLKEASGHWDFLKYARTANAEFHEIHVELSDQIRDVQENNSLALLNSAVKAAYAREALYWWQINFSHIVFQQRSLRATFERDEALQTDPVSALQKLPNAEAVKHYFLEEYFNTFDENRKQAEAFYENLRNKYRDLTMIENWPESLDDKKRQEMEEQFIELVREMGY